MIDRCLAKNPAQRFHSAHDLAFALRGVLSPSSEKVSTEPPRGVRFRLSVAIAVSLAILVVPGLFYWRSHKPFDFDWPPAEREFKRAISLNSNYAAAHEYYAWYLISMGRFDQGIQEGQRSVDLDPLSPEVHSILGWDLLYARRYDQAALELNKSLELDPNYFIACYMLGQVYAQ